MEAAKRIRPERRPAFSPNREVGQRGAETHARLLAAGLAVLDAAGYHGARVETIAERAGCSRPTFYQYFADKVDFFFHLASQVNGELGALTLAFPGIDRGRRSRYQLCDWLARFESLRSRYAPVFRFEALLRSDPRIGRGSEARVLGAGRRIASAVDAPLPTSVPLAYHGALVFSTITEAFGATPRQVTKKKVIKIAGSASEETEDLVATERQVIISVNDKKELSLYCTPTMIKEFVVGFILNEGIIKGHFCADSITVQYSEGKDISVNIPTDGEVSTEGMVRTTGCVGGITFERKEFKKVSDGFFVTSDTVRALYREFNQRSILFKSTGCMHSAAICDGERILVMAEDIGRHNAVDKVIGHCIIAKGADFGALVKRYSTYQGQAGPDGDVGFLSVAALQPNIRAGLEPLQPGEVSAVLPNQQGFNIFKVTDRKPERLYDVAEIKNDLPEAVAQVYFREKYDAWLKTLRSKAQIEYRGL